MAHIQLPEGLPGIVGPLVFSPETAKPLLQLAKRSCADQTPSPPPSAK
ncbi:MAG TPA: hypothetical protein VGJ06_17065 [Candidatus Acidoferrum sp.]|jgi:hypothetical protein